MRTGERVHSSSSVGLLGCIRWPVATSTCNTWKITTLKLARYDELKILTCFREWTNKSQGTWARTEFLSLSDLVKCLKFPRGPRGAKNAPSLITHIRKFVLKSIAFKCQRLLLVNPFGETTHSEEVQQLEDNINGVLAVEDVTHLSWTIHWLPDRSLERGVKNSAWENMGEGRLLLTPRFSLLYFAPPFSRAASQLTERLEKASLAFEFPCCHFFHILDLFSAFYFRKQVCLITCWGSTEFTELNLQRSFSSDLPGGAPVKGSTLPPPTLTSDTDWDGPVDGI